MSVTKKVLSLFLSALLLLTMFCAAPLTASAATTKAKSVVTYNTMQGGKVSSRKETFTVKANFWTKRKITIYGSSNFPNKKTTNAFASLAEFDIIVKDKNGKTIATYNDKSCGFSFKLPNWNKNNYTIIVTSYFDGYNRGSAYHQAAALSGKYYLKY